MQELTIGKNEAGQRLDKYLFKYLKEAPASFIYKMLRKKNIVLNGKKCTGSEQLSNGDTLKLFMADETIEKFAGKQMDTKTDYPYKQLDVIYEDEDMIFVNKPSGMLSQKAEPKDVSINEYIIGYLLKSGAIDKAQLSTFKPSVCNRLDRNTSGLILAGKSLAGSQYLSEIIKDRSLKKFYLAVVKGRVNADCSVEGYLIKNEKTNKVTVSKTAKGADKELYIRTDYKVLKAADKYSVLLVHLITGRSHQIRAHLSSIGHPLLGDFKYGDRNINKEYGLKDQLLHAYKVVLPDGREFMADPPKQFTTFM